MLIYKITNKLNNKIYVGQTTRTLEIRKKDHIHNVQKGIKTHLYSAMRKYGIENFVFEKICDVDSVENLNILERYYINKYNSVDKGYNMIDGGRNNIMFVPEVKELHDNIMRTQEVRQKISNSMKKYRQENPFTEEHRRKISEKMKGNRNFGSGDTRSIGCYCILEDGQKLEFHSYRDAWKWWITIENPFNTDAECVCQHKIKQSIENGYFTYGKDKIKYEYPKWFKCE